MSSPAIPSYPNGEIPSIIAPSIEAFAENLKRIMPVLMIGTVFASMLLPLLITVVYFSSGRSRRQPVFILAILSILIGLGLGSWIGVITIRAMVAPLRVQSNPEFFAFVIIASLTPWIVDFVLLFRLYAVFHPSQTSLSVRLAVFSFPVALKVIRLCVVLVFAGQWHNIFVKMGNAVEAVQSSWSISLCPRIEWVAEIFDHGFCSAIFMYRLRGSIRLSQSLTSGESTIAKRIHTLFWIAATNNVFPVIYNFVQIILVFSNASFFVGAYLLMLNTYVSIISVVFATVWSSAANVQPHERRTVIKHDGANDRKYTREGDGAVARPLGDLWVNEPSKVSNVPLRVIRQTQSNDEPGV